MTTEEFYNEFNLFYNNIASNQAPGLDRYEISVYLTKAQANLVDLLYAEYEQSEEIRRKLASLVVTKKLNIVTIPNAEIIYPEYTTTYKLPDDVRYIVGEQLRMGKTSDKCISGLFISIQPALHDEIQTIVRNPFRFNARRALRLDTSSDSRYIEILTKLKPVDYYQIRYIKNPDPIILDEFDELIDGKKNDVNVSYLGSLPDFMHRQVVELAAKLAYQDYKQ